MTEQGEAIRDCLNREDFRLQIEDCRFGTEPSTVEYFLVKGNYVKAVGGKV